MARVRSHIQIHERLLEYQEEIRPQSIDIGSLSIFPKERRGTVKGQEAVLTNKKFELFYSLRKIPILSFFICR